MMTTKGIAEPDLRELAGFFPEESLVVSLYLDVDGARHPRVQDYQKTLRNMINQAKKDWVNGGEEDKAKKKHLQKDLEAVEDYITGQWRRNGTKGLAVFSCAKEGFWQVYDLPTSVPSALIVGREPYTRTLMSLLSKYERYCVVAADRKKSRILTVYLGAVEEGRGVDVDEDVPDQVSEGEWAGLRQSRIARHIDDHVSRHLKEVANEAYHFFLEHDCDKLIVCGHEDVLPKLKQILHPYLSERLAGEFYIDPAAPAAEVLDRVIEIEEHARSEREADLLRQLEEESSQQGLGVVGLKDSLAALIRGQVDTLLIAEKYATAGYICYIDHYIDTKTGDCPVCGRPLSESEDIIEDMVQLAINHNVRVELIGGDSQFVVRDKVGALLRYRPRREETD